MCKLVKQVFLPLSAVYTVLSVLLSLGPLTDFDSVGNKGTMAAITEQSKQFNGTWGCIIMDYVHFVCTVFCLGNQLPLFFSSPYVTVRIKKHTAIFLGK